MGPGIEIVRADRSRVAELRSVFLSLHDHHRQVSAIPVTEPDDHAWRERMATYAEHFSEGRAVLHVAVHRDRLVGYAFTILHDGNDDTFPLAPRYAELYTLAVLPEMRSAGIGTALLSAVDDHLREAGITALTVAVMIDNDPAIRFYRRHGLIPSEVVLYRIGTG